MFRTGARAACAPVRRARTKIRRFLAIAMLISPVGHTHIIWRVIVAASELASFVLLIDTHYAASTRFS